MMIVSCMGVRTSGGRLLLVLVSSLVLFLSTSSAQHDDWEVRYRGVWNGQKMSLSKDGLTLVRVTEDSLEVFSSDRGGHSLTFPLTSLLEIRRRIAEQKTVRSVIIGAVAGAGAGYIGGRLADATAGKDQYGRQEESNTTPILAVVGGVVGAALGGLAAGSGGYESYDLADLSVEEKASVLRAVTGHERPPMVRKQTPRDVVSLKNGTVLRGRIMELIPDSTLTMVTGDESIFVISMRDVERITKEEGETPAPPTAPQPPVQKPPEPADTTHRKPALGFHGGVTIPAGDFGSTSGTGAGGAKTGFCFGGDIIFPLQKHVDWTLRVTMSWNSMDAGDAPRPTGLSVETGTWFLIRPMTGVRFRGGTGPKAEIYGELMAGMLVGNSPDVSILSGGSTIATQASGSATSFSIGVGLGLMFKKATIGVVTSMPVLSNMRSQQRVVSPRSRRSPNNPRPSFCWDWDSRSDLLFGWSCILDFGSRSCS